MLRLDSTLRKIEVLLGGAVASAQLTFVASWSDATTTSYSGGSSPGVTAGVTPVTVVAEPVAGVVRDVDYMSVTNTDSSASTVTVRYNDNGTLYPIISITIQPGSVLEYTHGNGWGVIEASGSLKTGVTGPAGPTGASGGQGLPGVSLYEGPQEDFSNDPISYCCGAAKSSGGGSVVVPTTAAGGRLTLSSGVPVMTSTVSGSSSVYYTPYTCPTIPLYNGTSWDMTEFTELVNTTTNNTTNPAAVGNSLNYDLFVWNDSGTIRLSRGPAWSTATTRGTGAGTSELVSVAGIWLNKVSITNGPAASRGTYVGSVRSNGTATIDWIFGGTGAGGVAGVLGVWNCYNRVQVSTMVADSTDSWTNSSSGAWRAFNNSASNRVSYISGLAEDSFEGKQLALVGNGVSSNGWSAVGYDSTTALSGTSISLLIPSNYCPATGSFATTSLGFHYMSAIEYPNGGTATFYGDFNVPTFLQSGFSFSGRF